MQKSKNKASGPSTSLDIHGQEVEMFLMYKDSQKHLSILPNRELNGYISLIIQKTFHYVKFAL